MSAKGDCIRAAQERLRSQIAMANSSSMECAERWLFICLYRKLKRTQFRKLKEEALKEFEEELRRCEDL